jgi:hypothetical protein
MFLSLKSQTLSPVDVLVEASLLFPAIQDSLFRQAMSATSHEDVDRLRRHPKHFLESVVPGSVFEFARLPGGPRHFALQVKFHTPTQLRVEKLVESNSFLITSKELMSLEDSDDEDADVDMKLFANGTAGKSLGGQCIKDERVGTAGKSLGADHPDFMDWGFAGYRVQIPETIGEEAENRYEYQPGLSVHLSMFEFIVLGGPAIGGSAP